jgi:hypothetical protein
MTGSVICTWLMLLALADVALAQNGSPAVSSRAEEIQAERAQKANNLEPERLTPAEQRLKKAKSIAETLLQRHNPHVQLGGLPTGSGMAAGPVFHWTNAPDDIRGRVYGIGSVYQYYLAGAGLTFPNLGSGSISLTLDGAHADSPRLDYYGSGPDSLKSNRTDYRQEDTTAEAQIRWDVWRNRVVMGAQAGAQLTNVGPGTQDGIASTAVVFTPAQAPGVDIQTNYFTSGYSVDFDFRDFSGDPHKGGRLFLGYNRYVDYKRDRFSFDYVVADAQYYIPFFNKKRVVALRARTELTHAGSGQVVPFYMQPVLGRNGDFRGFRPYRFRDNNLLLMNAEYRWEVSTGFDMALFGDVGRVFDHSRQMNLSNLEHAVGFGFRFKDRERVVMRVDTGFSREGFQVWVKFDNVF